MKKVILEEIENMKYLLGYKRGIVISEQITDKELDNLPSETTAATPPVVAAPVTDTTTAAPVNDTTTSAAPTTGSETPVTTIKMGVVNPRVKYLQQLLNQKFQSGLVDDGKYGPKTANAIYKNIEAINQTQLKPVEPINKTPEVIQQPAQQITANATIPQQ